jgi:prolipoprotein diacylglyceryltransferase
MASLIIFGLVWFRNSDFSPGVLFLNFVALTAGARLFLEAFRGDSALIFGEFRMVQVVAWAVLAIAIFVDKAIGHKRE